MIKIRSIRPRFDELLFLENVKERLQLIKPHLTPSDRILDIGVGTGMLFHYLKKDGFNLTGIDIQNKSLYPDVEPILYDGIQLPFAANSFDVCLIIAVLHHTPDPISIIKEAMRVGKSLVILEDIVLNPYQKYGTYIIDSVMNKQFFDHPRTYKTDREWKEIFASLRLRMIEATYLWHLLVVRNAFYVLSK